VPEPVPVRPAIASPEAKPSIDTKPSVPSVDAKAVEMEFDLKKELEKQVCSPWKIVENCFVVWLFRFV
jgi:hypothetical protein